MKEHEGAAEQAAPCVFMGKNNGNQQRSGPRETAGSPSLPPRGMTRATGSGVTEGVRPGITNSESEPPTLRQREALRTARRGGDARARTLAAHAAAR